MSTISLEDQIRELRKQAISDAENLGDFQKEVRKANKILFDEIGWLKSQLQVLQDELAEMKKNR
jgi:hypothetical protein